MSDIDRQALKRAPKVVAHKCHCGDWAGFGFCTADSQDQLCWKHYPYKTSARLEAAEIATKLTKTAA